MEGRRGEKKAESWLRGERGREARWAGKVGNTADGVKWEEGGVCGAKTSRRQQSSELREKGNGDGDGDG